MNKKLKTALLLCAVLLFGAACSSPDVGRLLEQYMWQKRVLLIFTPQFENPHYKKQLEDVLAQLPSLKERDMVVWTLENRSRVSVNQEHKPQLPTRPFYRYFKIDENQFAAILLGKDGLEKYRDSKTVSMKKLFDLIDAMPMRRREMQMNKEK